MAANSTAFGNNSVGFISIPVTLTATVGKGLFIKGSLDAVADVNDADCGVTLFATTATDRNTHTQIQGVAMCVAAGVIAQYARVETTSAGKVTTLSSGISRGKALDAAGADGDLIRVLLTPGQ